MNHLLQIKQEFWKSISNELKLLIGLTKNIKTESEILLSPGESFDWKLFIHLSEEHRLIPLLIRHSHLLNQWIPSQYNEQLQQLFVRHKLQSLQRMHEIMRIREAFIKTGTKVIAIKGPILAMQLYGDISMRQSHDIDLLLSSGDLCLYNKVMSTLGYQPKMLLTQRQKKHFIKHVNHFNYLHSQTNGIVELHWRLFSNPYLYPVNTNELFNRSTTIDLYGEKISTLNLMDTLCFLFVHGSLHQWFRLLWLGDISQIHNIFGLDWNQLLLKAREEGIENTLYIGLILSYIIYDTPLDKIKLPQFTDPILRNVKSSLKKISCEPNSTNPHTIKNIISTCRFMLPLQRSLKYKISVLPSLQTKYSHWQVIKLPDCLFWMYYLLHPFIWILKKKG